MTTAVVVTQEWELEAVGRAAAAGAFADDAPLLLVVATLDAVPEVRDSLLEALDPARRACFDEVHDLNALVAPQHPAAWDARDLAADADRVRSALGGVDRVVRPAGAPPPPVLPLLLPGARAAVLVSDALDVAFVRAGLVPAGDEVLAPADLAGLTGAGLTGAGLTGVPAGAGRRGTAPVAAGATPPRWTPPVRTDGRAPDLEVARRLVAAHADRAGRGTALTSDEPAALLAAVGVLVAARHGAPVEPGPAALARAVTRLRASARRPGLAWLAPWLAAATRAARARRAAASRARRAARVRRVRGAVRRRLDARARRAWERRVLAQAARDVRDPGLVAATTRRAPQ